MSTAGVTAWLSGHTSAAVYFDPLFGNHGDHLIELAAEQLLQDCGIGLVERAEDAELILINGGGGMAGRWPGMEIVLRYSQNHPHIPLAVLPSSFLFAAPQARELFAHRSAPIWLWAREKTSYQLLQSVRFNGDVHIGLDHDLAFGLAGSGWLEEAEQSVQGPGRQLLLVERDDWEGPTDRSRPLSVGGLGFIPEDWRNAVRRLLVAPLRNRQDRDSLFRYAALELLSQNGFADDRWSVLCADISLAETGSFDDFVTAIAQAAAIVTTRLHVAIVGHLMERPTWLVEGTYHKCRAVYDYSMRGGNTQLVRWQDGALLVADQDMG